MDEQFKNLKFDMDEEIEERRRTVKRRHGHRPMEISHAIILGAIIIVAGIWGGKIYYDHLKAQRIEAALMQFSHELNSIMQESTESDRQYKLEVRARELRQRNIEQARVDLSAAQSTQANKEAKLQSPECRFWWAQDQNNPNAKTAAKKMQSCGS
jgi:hypothetical protein